MSALPEGWVEKSISEISEIHNASRVPLSTKQRLKKQGCYPYYGASGIIDSIDEYIFDGEYVLISEDGENLNTRKTPIAFKADGKFWVNNHAHIVKGLTPYLNNYIVYYLKYTNLAPYITGAAQPKLSKGSLEAIPFLLPSSSSEQKAIADMLSSFDEKIELLREQNKTLETLAQTIFKEWFVHFNYPDHHGKPYRKSGGAMVDSELGLIPQGWRVGKLGEVAILSAGGDKPKNSTNEKTGNNKVPIYSNGVTNEGLYGFTDTPKVFEESVTVSARGTIGFVCLRFNPYVPIVRLISAVPMNKYLSGKYLFFWLKNKNISGFGTTQQQLTIPVFKKTEIIIPTSELMDTFTEAVDSFYFKIRNNTSQIKELSNTRDLLLPKLMSGQVRVLK